MSTEYKTWLAAKAAKVAEGDVSEYLIWYMQNPSPLRKPLGERAWTLDELRLLAIESAALAFKGTQVSLRHANESQAGTGWSNATEGLLGGLAFIVDGSRQTQGVVLQTEFHLAVIPVRSVIDMENAR